MNSPLALLRSSLPAGRPRPPRSIAILVAAALSLAAQFSDDAAMAQAPRTDLDIVNRQGGANRVNATVVAGNLLYIGGSFTRVGPWSGGGVPIDAASGQPVTGFPKVDGTISAAASDGAGGWYIGGAFSSVGGVPRTKLAHILSDNTVSDWNPVITGSIRALVVDGSVLYVGGDLSAIEGQTRNGLGAIDRVTGDPTAWNPGTGGVGVVLALAVSGSTVYAGGNFSSMGGQSRICLAAIDANTGVVTDWNPGATAGLSSPYVSAIAVVGSTVYVGGNFTSTGSWPRNRIAGIDAVTGIATTWNPGASDIVSALLVSGSTLYVGGNFSTLGGQTRLRIGSFDLATGSLVAGWQPHANSQVTALAASGSTIYAGGSFTVIGGGQARSFVAALDANANATSWMPEPDGIVFALAASASAVYVGGEFGAMGAATRNGLAALDLTTGRVTSWNPNPDRLVNTLAVSGSTVYVGGQFSAIGGQARNYVAAVDATSGNATTWNPNASAEVFALAVDAASVYVGGDFTNIGGQTRNRLAAFDLATGNVTGWNPNANGRVNTLTVDGATLYAGGGFTTIGAQTRNRIASFDVASGNLNGWSPEANNTVFAVAPGGGSVYVGGDFSVVGGQLRNRLAALDAVTGSAIASWNPNPNSLVRSLLVSGSKVYAAGDFSQISGQARVALAALDAATGLLMPWDANVQGPSVFSVVRSLASDGSTLYFGGTFDRVGGIPRSNLAGVEQVTTDVPPSGDPEWSSFESRPNPFDAFTTIGFTLPHEAEVTLVVYDVTGRERARLANRQRFGPGPQRLRFDGRGLESGVYVCLLRAGERSAVHRMVLTR